jgi:hypothetical protein
MTSFFNILINIPVGVTKKKKTIPMMTGDIIFPRKIPNCIHSLFKNVNKLGLIIAIIKNTKEIITDQILIGSTDING